MIKPGVYRHFKGNKYRVLHVPLDVNRSDEAGEPELGIVYMDTELNFYYRTYPNFTELVCMGPDCPNIMKRSDHRCLDNKCTTVPRFRLMEAE